MLKKLAENHKKWIAIAYNFCSCKETANDIVQDMYIKMHELNKEVDDGYIYFVIRSIFIESKRKQKEFATNSEVIDYYLSQEITENNFEFENIKKECYDLAYSKLCKHEKVIIHFSSTMGLREFARNSELSISLIQKTKRKLKKLVWEDFEALDILYVI